MANRIVGNVYIIDTATGNDAIDFGGGKAHVETIWFKSTNTTSTIVFTGANTATDIVLPILTDVNVPNTKDHHCGIDVDTLKVPTLTAATAYLLMR